MGISRRDLLRNLGAGAAGAALTTSLDARAVEPERRVDTRTQPPPAQATEDMYRREFEASLGDASELGFAYHCVNCQGNCAWEVWTKDGKVTRENQSARYPQIAPGIPDANPRGCNKGVQHSQHMYEADRLRYPMKRVGERGEGKWRRIGWDEAITEVATRLYETMLEKGPSGNYVHVGAGILTEAKAASVKRLGTLLGAVRPYIASYVGDMFPGASVVYGEGNIGATYDFVYQTDVAVFWGCNPNTSRIPDAHYLWEGKYNGSKVIVITPEFSSTAIHADRWIPVKPGGDGHLAMAVMQEIVAKKLYRPGFLKTFTDLPLLVRQDTGKLLRLSDLDPAAANLDSRLARLFGKGEEHDQDVFACIDARSRKVTPLPGCEGSRVDTLRLQDLDWDIDPQLEGAATVKLKGGGTARVVTGFMLLKKELARFSAPQVRDATGVHPAVIAELARDLTQSKVALITMGFAVGKHFNGLLSQRAIAALAALTGKLGPEGGLSTENEWNITGLAGLSGFDGRYTHRFASGFVSEFVLGDGLSSYDKQFAEEDVKRATGEGKQSYLEKVEALLAGGEGDGGKGKPWWGDVETFLLFADSRFRRNKAGYREAFLRKARFIAYGDYRMSDFAMHADVLLPCTSHYEAWDIRTNPGYHRFANIVHPPEKLARVGEAKSEWEISTLIVEKMEALAKAKAAATKDDRFLRIPDPTHTQAGFHAMDQLVEEFTAGGRLRTDRDAVEFALEHVDQFRPNSTRSMYERGGFLQLNDKAGKSSPLYPDRPYNSFENNLYLHQRFDTLTGRLTFYVDHDLWLQAGAAVTTAREPIRPRKYPLTLMTPHARWSIHSTYKTSPMLLRLNRGRPYVMINPKVAAARNIADGDDVRMRNDLGDAILMAKLAPGVPEDAVVMEHGWEPFMYRRKKGHNALVGDMLNLLELSDGWGHLKFGTNWDGNQHAYDATVELEKVS